MVPNRRWAGLLYTVLSSGEGVEFSRDSHRILAGFSWGSHSSRSAVWDTVSPNAARHSCFGLRFCQTQRSPEGPRHLHRIPRLSEAPWEVP